MGFKQFLLFENRETVLEKMRTVLQRFFPDGKKKTQLNNGIDTLRLALKDKRIYNVQLDAAKYIINIGFDKVRDYFHYPDFNVEDYRNNRDDSSTNWQNTLYMSNLMYPHQVTKFLKDAEKVPESKDLSTFFDISAEKCQDVCALQGNHR